MAQKQTAEIGLVLYPGAQQAAVLGLTDLFAVANRIATSYVRSSEPPLRVSHWQQETADAVPLRSFDNETGATSVLTALILPPALSDPVEANEVLSLTAWLREQHTKGVVLGSVCAGAFPLAATGMTTTEYYQRLRVGQARELLQFSKASIDRVAWEVGYSDPGAFRKVFTRIVGLSPSEYRRRFTVGQGAASAYAR